MSFYYLEALCPGGASGGARRSAGGQAQEEGARPLSPVTIEGRTIATASGASRGAHISSATATTPTACRAAAPTFATVRSSTCRSPGRGDARWSAARRCTGQDEHHAGRRQRTGRRSAATARGRIDSLVELLQGPSRQERHGSGLPPGRRASFLRRRNQAVVQLSGLGGHVQARRRGPLRRRHPARPSARASLRPARRRPERARSPAPGTTCRPRPPSRSPPARGARRR